MAERVADVVVEVGPGEVGEVVDQMADLEQEEEVGVVGTTMTTTPTEVPVVVRDVAVAVVAVVELEGDEEVHHRRHPPGHRLPQTTCRTKTFSLVSPSFTVHVSRLNLMERRRRPPTTTATQTSSAPSKTEPCSKDHESCRSP